MRIAQQVKPSAPARRPAGRPLVAGFEPLEGRTLMSASTLDTSFGGGTGTALSTVGTQAGFTSVVALPDGKVLAAGSAKVGAKLDFLVARYNANGTPDTTFGGGTGRALTDFGGGDDFAAALVLTGGGKFALVGTTLATPSANANFAVARYNANGTLDASFSGDGKQTVDFGGADDRAAAAALLSDGKLLLVGSTFADAPTGTDYAIARLTQSGALDTSFSGDGKVVSDFGTSIDPSGLDTRVGYQSPGGVAVLPSGQFLISGVLDNCGDCGVNQYDFTLARYNVNGTLDTSFGGGDGYGVAGPTGTDNAAGGVAVLPSGKVLVGGTYSDFSLTSGGEFAVLRFNANGSADGTFGGGDGFVSTDLTPNPADDSSRTTAGLAALSVQPNGKILAVGAATVANSDTGSETASLATVRYNANGTLDTSYSGDGKQLNAQLSFGSAVAAAPGGKTVVAGAKGTKAAVARFGSDFAATASIAGTVYNDKNANGIKDAGEGGLAGFQVFVDSNNDGFYTPGETVATSDAAGNYKLTGLLPGSFRVREVRPPDYTRTQPAGAYPLGYYDVTLATGQAVVGRNFGNKHV
jgi:uncharacterized delta-60 repeat protein